MAEMTGAELFVEMLKRNGVKHIFGLCGDTTLPLYDALARLDHGMDHVLARDERSAAYMADAYARVTGKVGVCEGPSGGGATYLLPGLVEANESSIPVLGITSDVAVTSRGKYPLTELDQQALYAPLTKWNTTIDLASQIPHAVRSAFRAMTTGRPGAAHICLPYDVLRTSLQATDTWAQPEHSSYPAMRAAANSNDIDQAVSRLLQAKLPVIIRGGGLIQSGACDDLEALATALQAPVCTAVSGKGSLAESHPLNVGVVGSNGGTPETREVVKQADLIFFIGCRAGSTTTEHWRYPDASTTILHLDADSMVVGTSYPTDVGMVGDAKATLALLNQCLQERLSERTSDAVNGQAIVQKAKAAKWANFQALAQSSDMPIKPERVVDALNRLLPAKSVVVADPGTPCPYFSAYLDLPQAGRYFMTNRAHGALGFALSAGIGAQFGRPDAMVVSLMGDGSFGFTCGELETLRRRDIPLKMIVFSNSSFGWIKASQRAGYDERYFSVDFGRSDHARIAEAFGIKAYTVTDPADLDTTLKNAFAHDGPVLVDVISQPLEQAAAPVSQWMG